MRDVEPCDCGFYRSLGPIDVGALGSSMRVLPPFS
jgi:hypothetical protein